MTKAAFNALITEFSIEDHFPGTIIKQKEGHVGLAIISDPAGDLWDLFIENKPVKVQIVDKESSFDFTERKVERLRNFEVRLKNGSFFCYVCVEYKINGKTHHVRNHRYDNITPSRIQGLYNPKKAVDLFEKDFGFGINSKIERTDLPQIQKQLDKKKVYSLLNTIMHNRFVAGDFLSHGSRDMYKKHADEANSAFDELCLLLGIEVDNA